VTGIPQAAFNYVLTDLAGSPRLPALGGVLTGYFRDADEVAATGRLVAAAKAANPGLVVLCDPIAGDGDGQYRPDAVVSAIRATLLPLADIITPNRYELAWLTGARADDNRALVASARSTGVPEVAVTSAHAPLGKTGTLLVTAETTVLAVHDEVPGAPHGTGDLFSALYLAHRLGGQRPADALLSATSAVLAIVRLAVAEGSSEMPIVSGQAAFLDPPRDVTLEFLG
jgi:pyridoxine kinase